MEMTFRRVFTFGSGDLFDVSHRVVNWSKKTMEACLNGLSESIVRCLRCTGSHGYTGMYPDMDECEGG